jgi:hypothetical protein
MGSRCRLAAVMCLVVLVSATGSSARDGSRTEGVVITAPSAEASLVNSQKRDLPWENQADIRERQTLAWIILLMKDGRGAR